MYPSLARPPADFEAWRELRVGQRVIITTGLLTGATGTIIAFYDSYGRQRPQDHPRYRQDSARVTIDYSPDRATPYGRIGQTKTVYVHRLSLIASTTHEVW